MAYVPPEPGTTVPGQATPAGVPKQSAHIADLPPEVRKNFLLSMIFFPSLVGAVVCLIMFLGWWVVFKPKQADDYVSELSSPNMRRRWQAARELSESINTPEATDKYKPDDRIYNDKLLNALIEIIKAPDLDKEANNWSPVSMIRDQESGARLRWWAAGMIGHVGGVMQDKQAKEKARSALETAIAEPSLAIYAARGLGLLKDPASRGVLSKLLLESMDTMEQLSREQSGSSVSLVAKAAEEKALDAEAAAAAACNALGAIGNQAAWDYAREQGLKSQDTALRATLEEAFKKQDFRALWKNFGPGLDAELKPFRDPIVTIFSRAEARAAKDPVILDNAAIALARLGDDRGGNRLHELEKSDDEVIRNHARRALDLLKAK